MVNEEGEGSVVAAAEYPDLLGMPGHPALRKVVRQAGTPPRRVVEELGAGWRAASPGVPALMGLHHFVYLFDGGG